MNFTISNDSKAFELSATKGRRVFNEIPKTYEPVDGFFAKYVNGKYVSEGRNAYGIFKRRDWRLVAVKHCDSAFVYVVAEAKEVPVDIEAQARSYRLYIESKKNERSFFDVILSK